MPLVLDEKKKDDERPIEEPDHAAPLRADVLGSIAGADPNSPGYLGKINHLITAHGALEKLNPFPRSGPDFSGMTSDSDQGASRLPQMDRPSALMTPPPAPAGGFVGENNVPGSTATGAERAFGTPTMAHRMQGDQPHRGWLGKIGHGLARMGNIAGDIFAPEVMAITPGTDLNKRIEAARSEKNKRLTDTAASEDELRAAQAEEAKARAESLRHPQAKEGLTPEETTIHDLMTGENGQPRVNPDTQQPYTYLEAYKAVQQAKQAAKPDKPDTETEEAQRYEKIRTAQTLKQQVSPEDVAWAQAYEKRKTLGPFANAAATAPQRSTDRSDKSFQYNNSALDKVAAPIDQLNQRLGRLNDSIAQNSPQADALVAPELLSVMAGGAGSGLRMNEAEIARIVGGRSNWESLQAAVNKWSLDPKEALSITPEQRQEIRALAKTVQDKLIAKEKIIDDARNALIDSDDPKEHRKIIADAKKALDRIDAGETAASAPPRPANVPGDYIFQENGPQGTGWYKPKPKP